MAFTFGPRLQTPQFGLLYNWHTISDGRGIAPTDWRVASDSDWTNLENYLGANPGTQLKPPNSFNALFAGLRNSAGTYSNFNAQGYWWTSIQASSTNGVARIIGGGSTITRVTYYNKNVGLSIRCVRDNQPPSSIVIDSDNNTYTWTKIGSQYWLAQNLATTKYNNGDSIDDVTWPSTSGAYSYPNGNSSLV